MTTNVTTPDATAVAVAELEAQLAGIAPILNDPATKPITHVALSGLVKDAASGALAKQLWAEKPALHAEFAEERLLNGFIQSRLHHARLI